MSHVIVVDYGAGNLLNVVRALEHVGARVMVTDQPDDITRADRLVLPGVGSFGECMASLKRLGLVQPLKEYVAQRRLFLGICVGMQVMLEVGEEFGEHEGLGLIQGRVVKIPSLAEGNNSYKVPHVGWAEIRPKLSGCWQDTPLSQLADDSYPSMYFVHSYAANPVHERDMVAVAEYHGMKLCAAVRTHRAYGVQFHPEKSADHGLRLLESFVTMAA